jgi:hypothetical protein
LRGRGGGVRGGGCGGSGGSGSSSSNWIKFLFSDDQKTNCKVSMSKEMKQNTSTI